eukprot:TRINITY_DN18589_c0_g2_i1.p1 TRINITY_DN18589_c0_g2~~TRINITY_DN18589_c0_g2_i1.p1  ORF type:complete len:230 (-),score=29.75 TRINITY_DN18589_c0_g2_i1:46-735(-)
MEQERSEDPQGGKCYNRFDRTRIETVYKQTVDKERRAREEGRQMNPGPPAYVINLANAQQHNKMNLNIRHSRLEILTDKVEKCSPQERMSLDGYDPNDADQVMVQHTMKKPTQKWDLPVSGAQEIGWLIATGGSANAIRTQQRQKRYPEAEALGFTSPPRELQKSASAPRLSHTASVHLPQDQKRNPMLRELNNNQFYRPKVFCEITKYADNYVRSMHHDPFNKSLAGR